MDKEREMLEMFAMSPFKPIADLADSLCGILVYGPHGGESIEERARTAAEEFKVLVEAYALKCAEVVCMAEIINVESRNE